MKSLFNKIVITAFAVLSTSMVSRAENDKAVCLEVAGIAVDQQNKPIDGVQVRLLKQNDELEWTEITSVEYHEHRFLFKLEPNEYYTIEVSKDGFVNRSVGISTAIPADISLKQVFRYEFEVEMFRQKENTDDYYLDFPVALIRYDKKRDVFDCSTSYTKHIKTMIRKSTGIEGCSIITRN